VHWKGESDTDDAWRHTISIYKHARYVQVHGKLGRFRQARQLVVQHAWAIDDPQAESLHWLEAATLWNECYQDKFRRPGLVQKLEQQQQQQPPPQPPQPPPALPPLLQRPPSSAPPRADATFPIRGLQRAMVKSMTAAWAAPHFGFADEVVLDPLLRTRDALRGVLAPHGLRLTFLPLLIKAASLALARTPALNGRLDAAGESFTHLAAHNIGVAMDTPRGLIVPNVKGVQGLSLLEIASELARLQALEGELQQSLEYLGTCLGCAPRTGKHSCPSCRTADHADREAPVLVAAVRTPPAHTEPTP
jgi:hypothetical protein